jgi:hypothetical protein
VRILIPTHPCTHSHTCAHICLRMLYPPPPYHTHTHIYIHAYTLQYERNLFKREHPQERAFTATAAGQTISMHAHDNPFESGALVYARTSRVCVCDELSYNGNITVVRTCMCVEL